MVNEPSACLEVRDLSVDYASPTGTVHAVDRASFTVRQGEIFGLAGESGSGKSTLAFAIARLLRPPAAITGGQVTFHPRRDPAHPEAPAPQQVLDLEGEALRRFRWSKLSVVFQSAMNALNPVLSIRAQIDDTLKAHAPHMNARARAERAETLLRMVSIAPDRLKSFPHELSGGMRQRVTIAIALALEPELVILDEPTTALDVVVQREILSELRELRDRLGFSMIFITHDLALLTEISDHLAIMYAGRLVELSPRAALRHHPDHPYSWGLLHAFPSLHGPRRQMLGIPGHPPDLRHLPDGCPFHPRCAFAFDACRVHQPTLQVPNPADPEHQVACHLYDPTFAPDGPPDTVDPTRATVANDQHPLPIGGLRA